MSYLVVSEKFNAKAVEFWNGLSESGARDIVFYYLLMEENY